MQFLIDQNSNRPVYLQIIDQVKRDVALGRLRPADKLPTVRSLAASLAINPNTIAKAYRQLEQEAIIHTRPGSGTFIAEITSSLGAHVKKRIITAQLEHTIIDAYHMGIDKDKIQDWFQTALNNFKLTEREK